MKKVKVLVSSKQENCACEMEKRNFYQEHGCCEWCFFVGEDIIVEMDESEVAEGEKIIQ